MSDVDFNAIADRLYSAPGTAPAATDPAVEPTLDATIQPAASEPAGSAQTPAEAKPAADAPVQFAEVPEAIRELRDDPLRRMFSPQGIYASVQLEKAMKGVALDPEIKATVAREYRETFADIGASGQDASELVDAAMRFAAEPITPERDVSNTNAAIELLNQHFGKDASSALADAQQMITRDPRLKTMLDSTRLGNDPAVVLKLAQLARSAKMRG